MKITKRQLRKMIHEVMVRDVEVKLSGPGISIAGTDYDLFAGPGGTVPVTIEKEPTYVLASEGVDEVLTVDGRAGMLNPPPTPLKSTQIDDILDAHSRGEQRFEVAGNVANITFQLRNLAESNSLGPREIRNILRENSERKSEIREFATSRSGQRVSREGKKITSAADIIRQEADNQTGHMRGALNIMAEFVGKVGNSLTGIGMLHEDESLTSQLPTARELKMLERAIKRLEK